MTPNADFSFKGPFRHSLEEFQEIVSIHQENTTPDVVIAFSHINRSFLEHKQDAEICRDHDLFLREMGSAQFIKKGEPVFDHEGLVEAWTDDFQEMARST